MSPMTRGVSSSNRMSSSAKAEVRDKADPAAKYNAKKAAKTTRMPAIARNGRCRWPAAAGSVGIEVGGEVAGDLVAEGQGVGIVGVVFQVAAEGAEGHDEGADGLQGVGASVVAGIAEGSEGVGAVVDVAGGVFVAGEAEMEA